MGKEQGHGGTSWTPPYPKKWATLIHPPQSHFLKRKRRLEIVISKPPQGYCILFWRVMTQPPKQRFFLLPLFDSVGEIK